MEVGQEKNMRGERRSREGRERRENSYNEVLEMQCRS
jgi:hypothetical protein